LGFRAKGKHRNVRKKKVKKGEKKAHRKARMSRENPFHASEGRGRHREKREKAQKGSTKTTKK